MINPGHSICSLWCLFTLWWLSFHFFCVLTYQIKLTIFKKVQPHFPANICWSSTRLQRNNFSSARTSSRRLEDVVKMSWKRFYKTSWRSLENVLKTTWKCCFPKRAHECQDSELFPGFFSFWSEFDERTCTARIARGP